jgi:hypothetical protein
LPLAGRATITRVQRILAVYDQRRTIGHVTMAPSLFQAVANALHWWEIVCRRFGTARRLSDDTVLDVIAEYFFSGNDVKGDLPEKDDLVDFLLDDPPSRAQRRELIAVKVQKKTASTTVGLASEDLEKPSADEELARAC